MTLILCVLDRPDIPGPRATCTACEAVVVRDTSFDGVIVCPICCAEVCAGLKAFTGRFPRIAARRPAIEALVRRFKDEAAA